jgi:hypothetical protein
MEILKKTCASIDARTPQLGYFAGLLEDLLCCKYN